MNNYQEAVSLLKYIESQKSEFEFMLRFRFGESVRVKISVYGVPYVPFPKMKEVYYIRKDIIMTPTGISSYRDNPSKDDLFIFFV
jgi:hypothetical protein